MNNKDILLSVVVPTKNRYAYLKLLIDLVDKLQDSRVELVIQDNTEDNQEILSFLKENSFPFINYNHIAESISMTENSDVAINNSHGEYICFIGDDDGFISTIISAVEYMKNKGIDVLLGSTTFYNWPDFYDPSIFSLSSSLLYKKGKATPKLIDCKKELCKCVKNGFDKLYKMPRAYQALVSRKCMDTVYQKYGSYFPGPSPDMANAVALSLLNPITYYFDSPIVISGQSRNVGGGERLMKNNELKKVTEIPFMPKDVMEKWDRHLPDYWCGDIIWPQSAIQAMEGQRIDFRVNYYLILAKFIFYHPSYYKELSDYYPNKFKFAFYSAFFFLKKIRDYLKHRVTYFFSGKKIMDGAYIIRNVSDMKNAVRYLDTIKTYF